MVTGRENGAVLKLMASPRLPSPRTSLLGTSSNLGVVGGRGIAQRGDIAYVRLGKVTNHTRCESLDGLNRGEGSLSGTLHSAAGHP